VERVRRGDLVEVIRGDERGRRGQVHRVLPDRGRVIVSGLNLVRKHQRPTGRVRTQAGIIEFEAPLHLSNVAPVCAGCDRWTRVGFGTSASGRKTRICRRCGHRLDE
jgi:large subunit ribosomal protein L24